MGCRRKGVWLGGALGESWPLSESPPRPKGGLLRSLGLEANGWEGRFARTRCDGGPRRAIGLGRVHFRLTGTAGELSHSRQTPCGGADELRIARHLGRRPGIGGIDRRRRAKHCGLLRRNFAERHYRPFHGIEGMRLRAPADAGCGALAGEHSVRAAARRPGARFRRPYDLLLLGVGQRPVCRCAHRNPRRDSVTTFRPTDRAETVARRGAGRRATEGQGLSRQRQCGSTKGNRTPCTGE